MKNKFDVIGFDADDTLWINQTNYDEIEFEYSKLLSDYIPQKELETELYSTEMKNIEIYGFGAKSFTLSMIETAIRVTKNDISIEIIKSIIDLGKKLINKPVELLNGVKEALDFIQGIGIKLILVTKGDLIDQERKLQKSNLEKYFHHIEIMSDKKEDDYKKLLTHLEIQPNRFVMIGNSVKSDILPVLNIGGHAIHIPYKTTWVHEDVKKPDKHPNLVEVTSIKHLVELFR